MAPRNAGQRAPITDDDDIDLDDIDTLPQDDDDAGTPGDDDEGGEPPDDGGDQPGDDEGDQPGDNESDQPGDNEGDQPAERDRARQPQRQEAQGRGDRRIRSLANENRELKTNLQAIQQRFDDFVRNQDAARREQQRETPEQRRQRRALLSVEERAAEDIQESEQRVSGMLSQAQLQIVDTTDKSAFDVKVRSDPLYARYAPKVESELAGLRQRGQNAPRESILKYLIGDAALKKRGSSENQQQRNAAQRRVDRQQARGTNARDDVPANRRRGGRSLEDRLADTPI